MINGLHVGLTAALLAGAGTASAAPVVWQSVAGGNGHAYELVLADNIGWQAARTAATARRYSGQTGYLATFTTRAEQEFVVQALGGGVTVNALWLGGYQSAGSSEPYAGWRWITGEPWQGVAGNDPVIPRADFGFNNLYFDGSPESVTITWWNSGGINDYVPTPNPAFGDGNGGPSRGFIVEFGTVPEPGSWALLLTGFGFTGWRLRRRPHARPAQCDGEGSLSDWAVCPGGRGSLA